MCSATQDSGMVPPGPKPVAAMQGTVISVEDLFYNVPTRQKVERIQSFCG